MRVKGRTGYVEMVPPGEGGGRSEWFVSPAEILEVRIRGRSLEIRGPRGRPQWITKGELDLLNGPIDLRNGARVSFKTFGDGRAPVVVDAPHDALLKAFETEMEIIGRAKDLPDKVKLEYINAATAAWLRHHTMDEVEKRYLRRGRGR